MSLTRKILCVLFVQILAGIPASVALIYANVPSARLGWIAVGSLWAFVGVCLLAFTVHAHKRQVRFLQKVQQA